VKIVLSFMLAGAWISGATFLGERLGSKKAGLIANLPSNIVLSLIFMALTSGPGYAAETTRGVPVGMAIDTLFVLVFMLVVKKGLGKALLASLGVWAAAALIFIRAIPPLGVAGAISLYLVVFVLCFSIAEWGLQVRMTEKRPSSPSWKQIAVRALFAGTVVAGAVTVAQFAPPYMTGILSTFPAVLSSTLVIFTLSQGADFARATGKILILSSSNIIVYAGVAGATFPSMGPWLGSLLAFLTSLVYISLLNLLVAKIR
jgi:hypothetical protein